MGIQHFFTYPRTPKMNPLAERFNRTIQEEAQLPMVSDPLEVWNAYLSHYLMQYNFWRPHTSLDFLTPVDKFIEAFHNSHQSNMLWTYTIHPNKTKS